MYIMSYITHLSAKCIQTQKISKKDSQASKKPEANLELDYSESLLNLETSLELNSLNSDKNLLPDLENKLLVLHSPNPKKEVFSKYKQSAPDKSTATRKSKKIQTKMKQLKVTSKPTWLYLLKDDNFLAQIKCEKIKSISEKS